MSALESKSSYLAQLCFSTSVLGFTISLNFIFVLVLVFQGIRPLSERCNKNKRVFVSRTLDFCFCCCCCCLLLFFCLFVYSVGYLDMVSDQVITKTAFRVLSQLAGRCWREDRERKLP